MYPRVSGGSNENYERGNPCCGRPVRRNGPYSRAVAALGAPVDLIYIDADHTEAGVTRDIRAAEECFPDALICGDDWSWPGVRQAVEKRAADSGGRLAVEADENWWVLSTTR